MTDHQAVPVDGWAPRDRLVVHLVWEAVLAVLAAALLIAAIAGTSGLRVSNLFAVIGALGLSASAVAFSFRTGTPNLAVPAIGALAAVVGAQLARDADVPVPVALSVGVVVGVVASALLGLVTAALSMPSWAVTLGGGAFILGIMRLSEDARQGILLPGGRSAGGIIWFFVFLLISIGGAALWWFVPGVRTMLSAARDVARPSRWTGLRPGLGAVVGITISGLLASLGGVAELLVRNIVFPGAIGSDAFYLSFAAALLGGTSIFGRRAGLLGTVLAVVLLEAVAVLVVQNADADVMPIITAIAILIGLGVGRAIESVSNTLDRHPPSGQIPTYAPPYGAPTPLTTPPPTPPAPPTTTFPTQSPPT